MKKKLFRYQLKITLIHLYRNKVVKFYDWFSFQVKKYIFKEKRRRNKNQFSLQNLLKEPQQSNKQFVNSIQTLMILRSEKLKNSLLLCALYAKFLYKLLRLDRITPPQFIHIQAAQFVLLQFYHKVKRSPKLRQTDPNKNLSDKNLLPLLLLMCW